MTTAKQHYDTLLGDHYTWSVAGSADPYERSAAWLTRHGLASASRYLDLGAGFGAHAVPLARAGKAVTAVDFHAGLLAELRAAAPSVATHEADLVTFVEAAAAAAPSGPPHATVGATTAPSASPTGAPVEPNSPGAVTATWDAILCLGDTLTHLADRRAVQRLLAAVARILAPGGLLALSYRDYSGPPRTDLERFIPVRSDHQRSLLCCIEALDADRVSVTDLVTTVTSAGLETRLSAYPKLRLAPADVAAWAAASGLRLERAAAEQGLQLQVFRSPG